MTVAGYDRLPAISTAITENVFGTSVVPQTIVTVVRSERLWS